MIIISVDSFLFSFITAVLRFGLGVNQSISVCHAAVLMCKVSYVGTKVAIYIYFVERSVC